MADLDGTYVLQLAVNDGARSGVDTVSISTNDVPPTADPSDNQNVVTGATAQLDGSGSTAVNGHVLTHSWSLLSRLDGSAAELSVRAAVNPTFLLDMDGTYIAQLIINDGTLDSAPATVTIISSGGQTQSVRRRH